eukprot:1157694-Pelagomonas_calceolata.AAC.22
MTHVHVHAHAINDTGGLLANGDADVRASRNGGLPWAGGRGHAPPVSIVMNMLVDDSDDDEDL